MAAYEELLQEGEVEGKEFGESVVRLVVVVGLIVAPHLSCDWRAVLLLVTPVVSAESTLSAAFVFDAVKKGKS